MERNNHNKIFSLLKRHGRGETNDEPATKKRRTIDSEPLLNDDIIHIIIPPYLDNVSLAAYVLINQRTLVQLLPELNRRLRKLEIKVTNRVEYILAQSHLFFYNYPHKRFDKINELGEISNISKGYGTHNDHFFVLTKHGQVYARGNNDKGQLGLGYQSGSVEVFTLVTTAPYPIKKIITSHGRSFAITENGEIYGCGYNQFGELGIGETLQCTDHFVLIKDIEGKVEYVLPHGGRTFAITDKNYIYACGYYNGVCLHTNDITIENKTKFVLIGQIAEKIQQAYIGDDALFLVTDKQVYAYGNNDNGQLGLEVLNSHACHYTLSDYDDENDEYGEERDRIRKYLANYKLQFTPVPTINFAVTHIAISNENTCFLSEKGDLLIAGSDDRQWLGHSKYNGPRFFTLPHTVKSFSHVDYAGVVIATQSEVWRVKWPICPQSALIPISNVSGKLLYLSNLEVLTDRALYYVGNNNGEIRANTPKLVIDTICLYQQFQRLINFIVARDKNTFNNLSQPDL